MPIVWHDALADVPDGPAIIIANEFFDALPVNQAVKQADGWHERVVGIDPEGNLAFALGPEPLKFFEQTLAAAGAHGRGRLDLRVARRRLYARGRAAASCAAAAAR